MTFNPQTACLSSELLGAFAEGRLSAEERNAVIAHLDTCDRCRDEVATLSDFIDDGAAPAQRLTAWWAAAAAAIVIIIAGAAVLWRAIPRETTPVAPLIAASAALDHRFVEPRLHGFDWAAYRGPVRATEDDRTPGRLKVLGAAGEVLQQAQSDASPEATHAAGVASLLIADPAAAIERLQGATEQSPADATAWSDLAAAHYELAMRLGRASHYPEALAAADRALRLDADLPEALFNRALTLERLGLIEDARAAWTRYLEVDDRSAWASEARRRWKALPSAAQPSAAFEKALETARPAELVAQFPQQARAFAEVELLARWGDEFRAGDHADASDSLARARAIGAALQQQSGEALLAEAVRAIDEADDEGRARFADAQLAYRSGRLALSRHDVELARRTLLRAASLFADPAALNARYYAAVAEYEAGRIATADAELKTLADELEKRPALQALRAQTAWQRGLVDGSQARWPEALEHYAQARTLFAKLGESSNAAFVDALIGEAAILLGGATKRGTAGPARCARSAGTGSTPACW